MPHTPLGSLDLRTLAARYRSGETTPRQVLAGIHARILADDDPAMFTLLLDFREVEQQIARAEARQRAGIPQPLLGIPFAIKDNIDLAGHPTTAGCREFAYVAKSSAAVVDALLSAGAMLIGKTNLDQFATGLVGVRSPYGTPANTFNAAYVPGGS